MCGQAISLAAIHLREEPDALMSARPGLCGGHPATGVPTAIANEELTAPPLTELCMATGKLPYVVTATFSSRDTSEMHDFPGSS